MVSEFDDSATGFTPIPMAVTMRLSAYDGGPDVTVEWLERPPIADVVLVASRLMNEYRAGSMWIEADDADKIRDLYAAARRGGWKSDRVRESPAEMDGLADWERELLERQATNSDAPVESRDGTGDRTDDHG